MNSMTGFGAVEGSGGTFRLSVEIKTLNTRYLDLIVSLPPSLSSLEGRVRDVLKSAFQRGRVDAAVRIRDVEEPLQVTVDRAAAQAWTSALGDLSNLLGRDAPVDLDLLTRMEGIFKVDRDRDLDAVLAALEPLLTEAVAQVHADRAREGAELARDIEKRIADIEGSLDRIADRAPELRSEVESSLRSRFTEILGDEAAEQRILGEIAAWIVRTDINEEIVRLRSHIAAFRDLAESSEPKGKKLDFLAQEMGREINTIGSKSPQADVSRDVVEMKDALEKVREQLRNVE